MVSNPNSYAARDSAAFLYPYTNALANEKDGFLVITRGNGIYVTDDAGKASPIIPMTITTRATVRMAPAILLISNEDMLEPQGVRK